MSLLRDSAALLVKFSLPAEHLGRVPWGQCSRPNQALVPPWLCWLHGARTRIFPSEGPATIAQGPCPLHWVHTSLSLSGSLSLSWTVLSQSLCLYFPPSPASALTQTPAIHQQQSHFCLESRLLLSALDPPSLPDSFLPMTHGPLKASHGHPAFLSQSKTYCRICSWSFLSPHPVCLQVQNKPRVWPFSLSSCFYPNLGHPCSPPGPAPQPLTAHPAPSPLAHTTNPSKSLHCL